MNKKPQRTQRSKEVTQRDLARRGAELTEEMYFSQSRPSEPYVFSSQTIIHFLTKN